MLLFFIIILYNAHLWLQASESYHINFPGNACEISKNLLVISETHHDRLEPSEYPYTILSQNYTTINVSHNLTCLDNYLDASSTWGYFFRVQKQCMGWTSLPTQSHAIFDGNYNFCVIRSRMDEESAAEVYAKGKRDHCLNFALQVRVRDPIKALGVDAERKQIALITPLKCMIVRKKGATCDLAAIPLSCMRVHDTREPKSPFGENVQKLTWISKNIVAVHDHKKLYFVDSSTLQAYAQHFPYPIDAFAMDQHTHVCYALMNGDIIQLNMRKKNLNNKYTYRGIANNVYSPDNKMPLHLIVNDNHYSIATPNGNELKITMITSSKLIIPNLTKAMSLVKTCSQKDRATFIEDYIKKHNSRAFGAYYFVRRKIRQLLEK